METQCFNLFSLLMARHTHLVSSKHGEDIVKKNLINRTKKKVHSHGERELVVSAAAHSLG